MDFSFTEEQQAIRPAIEKICAAFGDDYWRRKDREGGFPHDSHAALAGAGWLGIAMPTEAGGAGLGITEAAIMMQAVAESGGGIAAASTVHMNIFGLHPVVVFGTREQQQRWLPPLISGEHQACFGVTEPNTGLNTLKLKTQAVRDGDHYVVNGQKIWISTAQVAHKILLLARTTPIEEVTHPRGGLSLFYTDLDRSKIEVREIEKLGRKAVDSNQLFIDDLRIPVSDRIGEEGKGFDYILHGLCQGVSRRALLPRIDAAAHRPGQPPADLLLYRGKSARLAEILLSLAGPRLCGRAAHCGHSGFTPPIRWRRAGCWWSSAASRRGGSAC